MARVYVLLAAVCFGTTGTAQALGPGGASPLSVGAFRVLLGAALLILVARAAGLRPWSVRPLGPVLLGALGVAAYQAGFFAAVRMTGVAVGTLVALGSAPVLAGLLEWAVDRRPPGAVWMLATASCAAGVALLALGGAGTGGGVQWAGVASALAAGASYAVYTVSSKRLLTAGVPADAAMAAVFAGGAVVLAPVLLFVDIGWAASGGGLAMIAFLGVVPTALAYWLFARGLQRLSAAETSTLVLAEPATAALLAVLLLDEAVTPTMAIGAGILAGGLALLALPRRAGDPPKDVRSAATAVGA